MSHVFMTIYRIAGKCGGELNLAVWRSILQLHAKFKIRQNFLLAYIRMAIPYRNAKFKSANTILRFWAQLPNLIPPIFQVYIWKVIA